MVAHEPSGIIAEHLGEGGRVQGEAFAFEDGMGDAILEFHDIVLDPDRHQLSVRGNPVALPLKEFELQGLGNLYRQ
jgi:DNA-binding response OmpR family regulator